MPCYRRTGHEILLRNLIQSIFGDEEDMEDLGKPRAGLWDGPSETGTPSGLWGLCRG